MNVIFRENVQTLYHARKGIGRKISMEGGNKKDRKIV